MLLKNLGKTHKTQKNQQASMKTNFFGMVRRAVAYKLTDISEALPDLIRSMSRRRDDVGSKHL
jgi:hypothetical protein